MIKYYCKALIYTLYVLKKSWSLLINILYCYQKNKFADVSFEVFEKI